MGRVPVDIINDFKKRLKTGVDDCNRAQHPSSALLILHRDLLSAILNADTEYVYFLADGKKINL